MKSLLLLLVGASFAGMVSVSGELSARALDRVPPHMKDAFYSLIEEYAPAAGADAKEKFNMIDELLGTVEKRINEEKEQIYEKFKVKKESLRVELEKKLNADNSAIDALMAKKNATSQAVADARKELDGAIKEFKKSERAIIVAKQQQDAGERENEQRAKQLLERNEESRAEALDQASDELKMVTQVSGLVNSVKDSGVLCALCGDKKKDDIVAGLDADEILKKLGTDAKCNLTKTAEAGINFVKCLKAHRDDMSLCKKCQNAFSDAHIAAAPCHDNKNYVEGKFATKMADFNKMWQKRCPKECLCREVYEPVCGDDGQTYSNLCMAKCVGVVVSYHGRCGTKIGGGLTEEELALARQLANASAPQPKPVIVQNFSDVVRLSSADLVDKNTHTKTVKADA